MQPDDEGYLPLKNHPLRLKYKPVKHLVQMDTLDKLIERSKRIVNAMYKILGEVESQDCNFDRLAKRIISLDDQIVMINQGYQLFLAQYKLRKKEIKASLDVDLLWEEIE